MSVRRFDPYYKDDFGFRVMADMGESSFGDWVDYSDYAALEAQVKALSAPIAYEECQLHGSYSGVLSILEVNRIISARAALAATEPKP